MPAGAELRVVQLMNSRLYTLDGAANKDTVVLILPGGGYCMDLAKWYVPFSANVFSASCDAATLEYRLAPRHVYPCALEDAYEAFGHLKKKY